MERQKRQGPEAAKQQAAWEDAFRRIIAAEPGPERMRMKEAIAAEFGCGVSNVSNRFTAYLKWGEKAAARKERKDAGQPRGGDDTAAMKIKWQWYCQHPDYQPLRTARLLPIFVEDWCAPRGLTPRHYATMQKWRREVDERHGMTDKEAKRSSTSKHRLQAKYSNQVWIADQRTADVFVREPDEIDKETGEILTWREYRPYKFTFMDVKSGCPMGGGYYRAYDTATVEAALIDSIYPDPAYDLPMCGVPEGIWWDKGRQHWSKWALGSTESLGIKLHGKKSAGGEPTHHGLIEGWHHILLDEFEAGLPGYCGSDGKEENQPLALRLVHDGEAKPAELLTLGELNDLHRRWLPQFIRQPCKRHGSDDRASRLVRWQREMTKPALRDVPSRAELGWAFMHKDTRQVSGEGHIIWNHRAYTHPRLADFGGCEMEVRYLDGWTGALWVVLPETDQLVCIAEPLPDVFVGDNETVKHVARAHKAGRERVKDLKRTRQRVASLAEHGLISDEAAAAADVGLREAEEAIKPGRTVQVDVEQVMAPPKPALAAVAELHPRPGKRRLTQEPDTVAAEALAGFVMASTERESARPDNDEGLGLWK